MTDDDREAQRNREARHNEIEAQAEAEADAREARQHERRIQGYIDRYTDALCDQSILRMNSGSGGVEQDVVEFMEERQQTIDSFLAELNGMARRGGSMFTPQELARIVTSGASRADERLRAMRNDVIDGGDHGNARAAELILIPSRMRSTAPVAFPWLT
jgi:spore cortex formation protein SpoVR/YcgB (stage V sporulation)